MLSIPSSWKPDNNGYGNLSGTGPANEGEASNKDLFGVLNDISGLAGDVAGTLNSLGKKPGKNGTPENKPVIQPPDPDKERNWMLIGAAVVGAVVIVWLFKKF